MAAGSAHGRSRRTSAERCGRWPSICRSIAALAGWLGGRSEVQVVEVARDATTGFARALQLRRRISFVGEHLLGRLAYVNPFSELFLDSVNRDPELVRNMVEVLDRKRSPYETVPNGRMLAWVARALLRGRLDVALAFPGTVRSSLEMQRALRPRLKLLARARTRMARAPAAKAFQARAQMRNETPATSDG